MYEKAGKTTGSIPQAERPGKQSVRNYHNRSDPKLLLTLFKTNKKKFLNP